MRPLFASSRTSLRTATPLALVAMAVLATSAVGQGARAPAKQPPAAAPASSPPTLLGQFGDWGAYAATAGGRKVCYALAKPSSAQTKPPNRPRDPAYLFVASRPGENVRNEVSIAIGYAFKPSSEAAVQIGSSQFVMYTQNDGAWIKNAAEEAKLVEAMRKNGELVVTGVSGRGTQSTDKYSLKGLAQALDRANQECR